MIRLRNVLAVLPACGVFTLLVMTAFGQFPQSPAKSSEPKSATTSRNELANRQQFYIGVSGCAAGNCHGGSRAPDLAVKNNSSVNAAQVWLQKDPHRDAFATLKTPLSNKIAMALHANGDGERVAVDRADCRACHSTVSTLAEVAEDRRFDFEGEGVGCEACHGPANEWVNPHAFQRDEWQAGLRYNPTTGFRDTRNLAVRAKVCAGCHIGDSDRDMHHDMIAAGHPRLTFEFNSHLSRLPKHWDTTKDESRHLTSTSKPAYHAETWLIGQMASLQSGLELLESRVSRNATPNRWPELSEFNCYSCHHDIATESWVERSGNVGRLQWGSWLTGATDLYAPFSPVTELGSLAKRLSRRPNDKAPLKNQAAAALDQLQQELAALAPAGPDRGPRSQLSVASIRDLYQSALKAGETQDTSSGWDRAAQVYLAARALRDAIDDLDGPNARVDAELEKIRRNLLYVPGTKARGPFAPPARSETTRFVDTPAKTSPEYTPAEAVRDAYKRIQERESGE